MKTLFTIFVILFHMICFSQNRIKDTVYGNVKSVREKLYFLDSLQQTYKLFEWEGDYGHHGFRSRDIERHRFNIFWYSMPIVHYMNYYTEYDSASRIVTESWYNKDNSLETKYAFRYDQKGNLIQEVEINRYNDTVVNIRRGYNYLNRKTSELILLGKMMDYYFRSFEYDAGGNKIKQENYDYEGKENIRDYEYANGKVIKTYITVPSHTLEYNSNNDKVDSWARILRFEYEYDDRLNNTVVKDYRKSFERKNALPEVTNYQYDTNNNLTAKILPGGDTSWQYSYDNKNRIVDEKQVLKGITKIHGKSYYNGEILTKLIYTEGGITTTVTFSYTFDSHDNWTEQTKSINGKPLYVRKRDIVYY